jgi:hypothetical protein
LYYQAKFLDLIEGESLKSNTFSLQKTILVENGIWYDFVNHLLPGG